MSFAFKQLPPELRLEIWGIAVQTNARQRLVIEHKSQVFPTRNLVTSAFFSVNAESREVATAFYPVRLAVYRRRGSPESRAYELLAPESVPDTEGTPRPEDCSGAVYLRPELDTIISIYPRAELRGISNITILGNYSKGMAMDHAERSMAAAWHQRAEAMSRDTLRLFHRVPDKLCLMRYAAGRLGVRDWMAVDEWLLEFGEEEHRTVLGLLRSMRLNSSEFVQVFGWG
ncbi:hypothetical protein F4861DRAFT_542162 [Xylaria intraflava]|nr:hypothetical protein F4861DRAFT_542162 [Xylaria intraflava]